MPENMQGYWDLKRRLERVREELGLSRAHVVQPTDHKED